MQETLKTKTFWGGIASIATGVGLVCAGEQPAGINAIVAGVLAICVRDGISKIENK